DRQTRDETLSWLKQTAASWGIPVLAATHDYDIAVQADALALLAGGRIIQFGPTMELFAAPVSPEAAALLGV
ncbi:ABC transporter ATP-binding protein, partial [Acidocella sp. MX-AZ02]